MPRKLRVLPGLVDDDAWYVRSSVIRRHDLAAIFGIVNGTHIMAGTMQAQNAVSPEDFVELPPSQQHFATIEGDAKVMIGADVPIVVDWSSRPERFALPVDRYLRRHCRPRFPRHLVTYFIVPSLILGSGAIVQAVLLLNNNPIWYVTIPFVLVAAVVASAITERRRFRREQPAPPPHRLDFRSDSRHSL